MAQLLELSKLLQKYSMPEMKIWCSRVEPGLNPQRHPGLFRLFKLFHQFFLEQYFNRSPTYYFQLFTD